MSKYFYVIFTFIALVNAARCFWQDKDTEAAVWLLIYLVAMGIEDILDELENRNNVQD